MPRRMWGLTTLLVAAGLTTAFAAAATEASPTRSGSDGKIAFASTEDDPGGDIWTMNADGSDRVNLTPSRPEQDAGPNWSPDGSRIVFTSIAADGNWDVWVVNADGQGLRRLTADPARDSLPAWSPDGRKIVFRSERTGNSDLYVMNADGSRVRQLTNDPSFEAHAEYSPDGDKIVFDRRPPTALFTMRADGTKITQITPDGLYALDADWSRHGNRLVFINGFCGPCPYNEVVTMKANGKKVVQLTNDNGVDGYNMSPSWSPDGKKIVFSHEPPEGPPSDIHVISADGSGRTNITDTPDIDEFTPDWWGADGG